MRLTGVATAILRLFSFRKPKFKHPASYYQERAGILLLSIALLIGGYLLLNQTKTTQITFKEDPPQVEQAATPTSTAATTSAAPAGQIVSLNTGTATDLDTLPGVGPATAQKIIAYRTQHGSFKTVEGIMDVSGIGPAKYAKMKPFLRL
jgi:comEA protein